jgi:hypothetical protein
MFNVRCSMFAFLFQISVYYPKISGQNPNHFPSVLSVQSVVKTFL